MAGFVVKQPNGRYCRFSTVVDCPTHINMTYIDYIKNVGPQYNGSVEESIDVLENHLQPFEMIKEKFVPNNMSENKFAELLAKMEDQNPSYYESI